MLGLKKISRICIAHRPSGNDNECGCYSVLYAWSYSELFTGIISFNPVNHLI